MVQITGTGGDDTITPLLNTVGGPPPGAGDDRLEGLGGHDILAGGAGIDSLFGGAGNDTLDGGAGIDLLDGGIGIDWLSYATDTAGVAIDLYFRSALGGQAEGDSIASGFEGLLGGAGNDAIIAHDEVDDTILGAGGDDTIQSFGDFALSRDLLDGGAGDDSIVAYGGSHTLVGGAGADTLRGGTGLDILVGGSGADLMSGGAQVDTVTYAGSSAGVTVDLALGLGSGGDAAGDTLAADIENLVGTDDADRLAGGAGDNRLQGGAGNDTLLGDAGDDWLDGGTAADSMRGGVGDDTYMLMDPGDVAFEAAGEGRDLILTSRAVFALGANLEDLGGGSDAQRLVGNAVANLISGGGDASTLIGGAGNDTLEGYGDDARLVGGAGGDSYLVEEPGAILVELAGQGYDTVLTRLAAFTLDANLEALVATNAIAHRFTGNALNNQLVGEAGADTLSGAAGHDTIDGGAGIDRLAGGLGDDRYIVTAGDAVVEFAGQGNDIVMATTGTAAALGANLEGLLLAGETLRRGTGNGLDNLIFGNGAANLLSGLAGDDSLSGGLGADILLGGAGQDTLSGGAGNDVFRLVAAGDSTAAAPDRITDFTRAAGPGVDRVDLRGIDANALVDGNQAFAFIGTAAFAGGGAAGAGQWRVAAAGAGAWRAEGDTDGDGVADVAVDILSPATPAAGWFLL